MGLDFRVIATVADGRTRKIAFGTEESARDWAVASFQGLKWKGYQAEYQGHAINVKTLAGSPLIEVIIIDLNTANGFVLTADNVEGMTVQPPLQQRRAPGQRQGPEEALLLEYVRHLRENLGHEVELHTRYPNGRENDAYDLTDETLIEAKASNKHNHVRKAFAQLMEYRGLETRSVASLVVLLPDRPSEDSAKLLKDNKVKAVWPASDRSKRGESWATP